MAGIVDEERKVKHVKLSEKVEEVVTDPSRLQLRMNANKVDIAYPPILQSGGVYDLRISAQSDERVLQYDVVLASLGAR